MGGRAHLDTAVIIDVAYNPSNQSVIFTQQLPPGSRPQTYNQDQAWHGTGAPRLPFVPGRNALSKLRGPVSQAPQPHGAPSGGTQQEESSPGPGRPQIQAGDANSLPIAQCWAGAQPSGQASYRQHTSIPDAEQMTLLFAVAPREAAKSPGPASADI